MKRTLTISCCAWLLAACAPDLDANGAAGCDEHTPCDLGASCYRGLCVPDALDASAFESEEDAAPAQSSFDAGQGLMSTGSAVEAPPEDAGELTDADEAVAADADEGSVPDAGAPRAPEPAPDAARPAATPDAGAPTPVPKPAPDAGRPAASSPCTLKACCDEARKAYESNQKLDGRWNARKGKCGCGDADLFRALSCGSSTRSPS